MSNIDKSTNERIWTAAQREVIFSTSERLLVAASAGSGKTAVMTERIARLIEGGASLKNMLIVTFTVSAASEMRSRLQKRLEGSAAGFRREDLYAADIGTLHSFCKKLITQFFYKLGLDPGFVVAEGAELAGLKEAAADAAVAECFLSGDEVFNGLADFLAAGKRRDSALKNTVKRIYEFSHNSADADTWLENAHLFSENSPCPCDKNLTPYVRKLAETARLFSEKYDGLKGRDARLDFIDLERLALKLLDDPEVLEFVRDKYKYVFVDEYQDINPKQEAIISKAAEGGSLFMVGDLKQSIYGFRSCEPQIFIDKMASAKRTDGGFAPLTLITLNDNFRSRPEILRFCDDVFGRLMTAGSCGIDYTGDSRFGPGLPFAEASAFPAVSCRFTEGGGAEDEARAIADAVKGILGEKIYLPKEKICRSIGYGDIAVLMGVVRGRYSRAVYRALLRLGVPVRSETGPGTGVPPEVRLLIDFMRVIDNPMQDIPLAAVMRSRFFRFADGELADIRRAFPAEPFFHLCVFNATETRAALPPALRDKTRAFTAELERLKEISGGVSAAQLLEIICRDFDYEGGLVSGGGGEDAARAVEGFIAAVRENRFASTLGGFIAAADDFGAEESVEPPPRDANCVRLSSIHHAKGMEFPVVILAASGLKFTDMNTRLPVICHKDMGIAVKPSGGRKEEGNGGAAFCAAADKAFEAENREKQRLLYVALTRAQNHLIITGSYKTPKNAEEEDAPRAAGSFLEWLRLYRSDVCRYTECAPKETHGGGGEPETELFGEPDGEYLDAYLNAPEQAYPFAAAAAAPAKTTATRLMKRQAAAGIRQTEAGMPQTAAAELEDEYAGAYGFGGGRMTERTAKGTAYHTLLKHINTGAVTQNEIVAEMERLVAEGLLPPAAASLIDLEKIGACMNSPLFDRARRAKQIWREQDFLYLLKEDGTETLIQGAIDLMFRETDGLVIADYKLSGLPAKVLSELYKSQLDIYAAAAESIMGLPVKEKLLFLLSGGVTVRL